MLKNLQQSGAAIITQSTRVRRNGSIIVIPQSGPKKLLKKLSRLPNQDDYLLPQNLPGGFLLSHRAVALNAVR